MICSQCYKSFEGPGTVCPGCGGASAGSSRSQQTSVTLPRSEENAVYPAGMFGRIIAFLFDVFFLSLFTYFLIAPFVSFFIRDLYLKKVVPLILNGSAMSVTGLFFSAASAYVAEFFVLVSVSPLYYVLFETSRFQATPGKILTGLIVTDLSGNKLNFSRAFLRVLSRWIFIVPILLVIPLIIVATSLKSVGLMKLTPSLVLLSMVIWLVTYPVAFFTALKQGLHDLLSGCVVQEADQPAPAYGFPAAVFGIVVFLAVFLYTARDAKDWEIKRKMQFKKDFSFAFKRGSSATDKSGYRVISPDSALPVKNEAKAEEAPVLSEPGVAMGQAVFPLSKISSTVGATRRTVNILFFSGEREVARAALSFRWPVTNGCSATELERYSITFFTPENERYSVSRQGSPGKQEISNISCQKSEGELLLRFLFKGSIVRNSDFTQFQWNLNGESRAALE